MSGAEVERCGYAVTDEDGIEGPCDRPVTGWRWYQDCGHEPALERACVHHENDGGYAVAALTAERDALRATVERVEGLADRLLAADEGATARDEHTITVLHRAGRLIRQALNPPPASTSAPHSASEGSSGTRARPDDSGPSTGHTCGPDCPAAIREAHLRQRLTELADRLARGSSAVCDLLDEAEGPGERGEG